VTRSSPNGHPLVSGPRACHDRTTSGRQTKFRQSRAAGKPLNRQQCSLCFGLPFDSDHLVGRRARRGLLKRWFVLTSQATSTLQPGCKHAPTRVRILVSASLQRVYSLFPPGLAAQVRLGRPDWVQESGLFGLSVRLTSAFTGKTEKLMTICHRLSPLSKRIGGETLFGTPSSCGSHSALVASNSACRRAICVTIEPAS
jgi:hypothetical protein